MVFGIIPGCRSASIRNERSASPESPQCTGCRSKSGQVVLRCGPRSDTSWRCKTWAMSSTCVLLPASLVDVAKSRVSASRIWNIGRKRPTGWPVPVVHRQRPHEHTARSEANATGTFTGTLLQTGELAWVTLSGAGMLGTLPYGSFAQSLAKVSIDDSSTSYDL